MRLPEPQSSMETRLHLHARIPVLLSPQAHSADAVSISHDNKSTLQALIRMEENLSELDEEAHQKQFRYLDGKLNLLLDMFSQLLQTIKPLPTARQLWLTVDECEILIPESRTVGELVHINLVLNPRYPIQIRLPASVAACESLPSKEMYRLRCTLQHAEAEVSDLLEQYIFIQHRRAVAHKKAVN